MNKNKKKDETIMIRVTESDKYKIKKEALKRKMSITDFVLQTLKWRIEKKL